MSERSKKTIRLYSRIVSRILLYVSIPFAIVVYLEQLYFNDNLAQAFGRIEMWRCHWKWVCSRSIFFSCFSSAMTCTHTDAVTCSCMYSANAITMHWTCNGGCVWYLHTAALIIARAIMRVETQQEEWARQKGKETRERQTYKMNETTY